MLNGETHARSDAATAAADPELLAKLGALRQRMQVSFGQVVLALMGAPRYRHQSLADLSHLVLDPLSRDRVAVATTAAGGQEGVLAGVAIWATVSETVDAAIREQIRAGVFPVRLKPEDWAGGEIVWLLDVIAPSRKLCTGVLANFGALAKDRPVNIHPLVGRMVDPEVLTKLRAPTLQTAGETADALSASAGAH